MRILSCLFFLITLNSCSKQQPAPLQASGSVHSKVCASCHSAQAKTYQATGMGRSFSSATLEQMPSKLDKPAAFYHKPSDRYYQITHREGRFFMRRHQLTPDGREENVVEAEIHYVVGSGNHSRTYLSRTSDNHLLQLPVSWYSENGGTLAMSPGYDTPNHQDFRRKVAFNCMSCHNGYPQLAAGKDLPGNEPIYPTNMPQGIDCQRCHGNGLAHLEALKKGLPVAEVKRAIVNPARLSSERQMEVCMQCHLETTSFELPGAIQRYDRGVFSYQPGEALADHQLHFDHAPGTGHDGKFEIASAAYRLRQAACFLKSSGKLSCTTCHNPHNIPLGEAAQTHYTEVCRSCHATALATSKHKPQANCISCHMPKRRTDDVIHVAVTDHKIQRKLPGDLLAAKTERHESEAQAYRGEVKLYYPPTLTSTADNDLYVALAQVAQKSNLAKGVTLLEAALRTHRPQTSHFQVDLAAAYSQQGDLQKAIAKYQEVLQREPQSLKAQRGLGSALLRTGDATQAATILEQVRTQDPRDTATLHELGRAYYQSGKRAEATTLLQSALAVDPALPEVYDSLANMLAESGNSSEAAKAYREAIRHQPDFALAHSNLANLLLLQGDLTEADRLFKKSVTLDSENPRTRLAYAIALARTSRFPESEEQIKQAIRIQPQFAEALEMQGSLLARRGQWLPAAQSYRQALKAQPRFGRALLGLGTALAATGDLVGAKSNLSQAAVDADATIRQEATELLREIEAPRR